MATNQPSSAPQKSSSEWTPWADDPILQEVYAIRDAISAECDHDRKKIFERLKGTAATSTLKRSAIQPVVPRTGDMARWETGHPDA